MNVEAIRLARHPTGSVFGRKGASSMVDWFKTKLKWLLVAAALAGPVFAVIGLIDVDRVNNIVAKGVEGNALITSATRKKGRRGGTTHYVDLAWRDTGGASRTAEQVRVSSTMARKLFAEDRIVVDGVRIKYLTDNPSKEGLVISDDVDEELSLDRFMMWGGAVLGMIGLVGCTFMFGLLGYLRPRPPSEELAGGPRSNMGPPPLR